MRVTRPVTRPAISLSCMHPRPKAVRVQAGAEKDGVKLQVIQADSLFLSLDPGAWPAGCALTQWLHNRAVTARQIPSNSAGCIRLPSIESFR